MRRAAWFFDFVSPYAYLQFHRLADLPADVEVELKPVLFAGLLDHWGQLGPAEIAPKRRHTALLTRWRALRRGVPFTSPPRHPFNPLTLLRLAIALGATRAVVGTIFAHVWAEGRDGEAAESMAALAATLGGVDVAALTADPAVKQALRDNAGAALAAGVYGVPTFLIEGETFWGDDMFELMLDWLADPTAVDDAALRAALDRPPASTRPRRN